MNLKQKTFFKVSTVLLTVMLTAVSCNLFGGKKREPPIELTWWKPFEETSLVQPLVEEFNKTYPNTRITYVQKNIETYEDELIDALASGTGPDIFSIHNDWLPKHKEKLAPAPPAIFSLRDFQQDFVPVAVFDLVKDEKIYAAPLAIDVLAMYYNKDILASSSIARPPVTWEELVELTPRLTKQDNFGDFQRSAAALGTANNINRAPDILGLLMLQNGTQFYSPELSESLIDEALRDQEGNNFSPGARALEFYTQFANPGKVTYTWNSRSNNSVEAFSNGKVAMIFSYAYLRPTLSQRAPFLNYAVAPIPQLDPSQNRVNFANYWAEGVSKQSHNQEAAWQFLRFISRKDVLLKYYEAEKKPSSRLDIIEQQIKDPEIGVFAEEALTAKSFYKPNSDGIESIFVQMIDNVVLRNISPQEAISAAAQKINLLLRKP